MAPRIVIIDYHKGNLLSVARSLSDVGAEVEITDDPGKIAAAEALVLPGVGSFEDAMGFLDESGEGAALVDALTRKVPFLGICLGEHLIMEGGDEAESGWCEGLGVVRGTVRRLDDSTLKVPHVGWDQLELTDVGRSCPLFAGVADGAHVYFTHSYALSDAVDPGVVAARTDYTRAFPSAIWDGGTLFAVQFHPEKSSTVGLRILENFVRLVQGGGA